MAAALFAKHNVATAAHLCRPASPLASALILSRRTGKEEKLQS